MVNLEKLGSFGEGRKRKRLEEYVRLVNSFEPELEEVMTPDLPAKTQELRRRLEGGGVGREINFAQRPPGQVHSVVIATRLRRAIRGVMLHARENRVRVGKIVALKAAHSGPRNL